MYSIYQNSNIFIAATNITYDNKMLDKWIEALRSGDYVQGTNNLFCKTTNKYCCLGVLGRLCGYDNNVDKEEAFLFEFPFSTIIKFSAIVYSDEGIRTLSLDKFEPIVQEMESQTFFAHLNDSLGLTFDEIADVLESFKHNKYTAEEKNELLVEFNRKNRKV